MQTSVSEGLEFSSSNGDYLQYPASTQQHRENISMEQPQLVVGIKTVAFQNFRKKTSNADLVLLMYRGRIIRTIILTTVITDECPFLQS